MADTKKPSLQPISVERQNRIDKHKENEKLKEKRGPKVIYPNSPKPEGYKTVISHYIGKSKKYADALLASYISSDMAKVYQKKMDEGLYTQIVSIK
jgi:hypothetical protein